MTYLDEPETCDNCGVDVDKEPYVLCDECEDTGDGAAVLALRDLVAAAKRACSAGPGCEDWDDVCRAVSAAENVLGEEVDEQHNAPTYDEPAGAPPSGEEVGGE